MEKPAETLNSIGKKWQSEWHVKKAFEPEADNNLEKFFLTFPYPYINAFPHIGHLYTIIRVDAYARYKRLCGLNVLFPQGWHATGSPIVSAAKRVKDKEPKQLKLLKDMGIADKDLLDFEKPEYWIRFFAPRVKVDYQDLGLSIDWRREFHTTSLNPHYNKFIEWQFRILKKKGYVIRGKFPVVWDPKDNVPVGDHDRIQGEGEVPQEFVLLKFAMDNEYLVAATLRPETMFGQTNLWIGPDIEYVKAIVNDETWIISKECANKLGHQEYKVEIIGTIHGRDIVGRLVKAPVIDRGIPVLPATFCDPNKGTGIVTSVPSDAPDDWMGLVDLKNAPDELKKHGIDPTIVESIEVIPIIHSADLGDTAALKVCKDMNIKSSREREMLEKAKKLVYKKGFYEGIMLDSTGKYAGMKVEAAKELIKQDLISGGIAHIFYELTGKVIARSLSECIVKIVDDQWFLNYADPKWKQLAHDCLDRMKLYPEKARQQFDYVIDWLHEWACTREEGLGTKLPWDHKWLIESLSDSTIYMAYYTVAHRIKDIPVEDIDDDFFDYVFLGKDAELKIDKNTADALRHEFEYWYPVDFRNSGKDLIQNHLTFFIFNHTAIFPETRWPKGIGVNGWVTVDGQKMSKSLGNVILVRDMVAEYGPDVPRMTMLSGGEDLDDPNWETALARSLVIKLQQWLTFCKESYGNGRDDMLEIDYWMEARLNEITKKASEAMAATQFRTAIQAIYYELTKHLKWYIKRCKVPNKKIINSSIETQIIMLSPFTPHICEEAWEAIGKNGFVSHAQWPKFTEDKITEDAEWLIRDLISDMQTVTKLANIDKPRKITIILSELWRYELLDKMKELMRSLNDPKDIISGIMKTDLKVHSKDIMGIIPKVMKAGIPQHLDAAKEKSVILEALSYLESEMGCEIILEDAKTSVHNKAKQAMPGKPALLAES